MNHCSRPKNLHLQRGLDSLKSRAALPKSHDPIQKKSSPPLETPHPLRTLSHNHINHFRNLKQLRETNPRRNNTQLEILPKCVERPSLTFLTIPSVMPQIS